jgi:CRISPR/Cas system-associated exonuclease Cas4 (RecB family)
MFHRAMELIRLTSSVNLIDIMAVIEQETIDKLKAEGRWDNTNPDLIAQDLLLVKGLLEHYLIWQKTNKTFLADHFWDFTPERPFSVPFFNPTKRVQVRLTGTYDGIIKYKGDRFGSEGYFLKEYKTCRSIPERLKQLELDDQPKLYLLAAREATGLNIQGVVYTLVRKSLPKTPELLKSGVLSKSIKNGEYFNTSAEWYLQTIRTVHPDWTNAQITEEYGEVLQKLLTNPNNYFERTIIRYSEEQLNAFSKELKAIVKEMLRPSVLIYPSPSHACNYCNFRSPCLAEASVETSILASQYIKNGRYV